MDAFHGAFAFAAMSFCPLPILDIAVVRIVTIAIAMQCRALGALHLQGIGRVVRVLPGGTALSERRSGAIRLREIRPAQLLEQL
jgi:hypothetical protein